MGDFTNICILSALLGISWVYFKSYSRKLNVLNRMLREIGDTVHTPASLRGDKKMRDNQNHYCMVTGLLMSPGRNYVT